MVLHNSAADAAKARATERVHLIDAIQLLRPQFDTGKLRQYGEHRGNRGLEAVLLTAQLADTHAAQFAGDGVATIRLFAAAPDLLGRLKDHVENTVGIEGPICPSCGRDNSGYGDICTSDDCMGVLDRAAIAKAEGPR